MNLKSGKAQEKVGALCCLSMGPRMPVESQSIRIESERRQVTVLFADMVGFAAFSERSGEEAAFKLIQCIARLLREAVQSTAAPCGGLPVTA